MVVSPQHFKEVTNGYEKRSDGLYVHQGKADIGTVRVTNNLSTPALGAGMEMLYDRSGQYGLIQVYDRDANLWRDLYLNGRNITLAPQAGGKVTLPAGTAQQYLGGYMGNPSFTTTSTGSWLATPLTTGSVACTGVNLRIEAHATINHSAGAGAGWHTGLMIDGGAFWNLSQTSSPAANYWTNIAWTVYMTPSVANHTFTFMVYVITPGTLSLHNGLVSSIHVNEQRA